MTRKTWIQNKYKEYITNYGLSDNLIYEWWKIVKYENSKQYIEDTNRYHLTKQIKELERKNKYLNIIANTKLTKDLELEVKGETPSEYHQKIYLLKSKRW